MAQPNDTDQTQADPPAAAPTLLAATVFLERLRACDLLDDAQWAAISVLPSAQLADARILARELIQRGWLTPFQVNQLFQDRGVHLSVESYVLLERLGEGGMGQVFKARHRKLGQIVAIKVIRKDRLANADAIRRFRREIRTTSQLAHANIVRALDAGDVGNAHYLVMEFIDGVDLSKLVRRRGMLPPREACDYVRQAALGLQYAHEHGIVHRDVKPSNLLLRANTTQPVLMILDLGLARRLDRESADASTTLTDEGVVMGTPDYIAPEQAEESHTVDGRADVYSLGCTLYYLLNAKPPFGGTSLATKLRQHLFAEPTPIEQLRDDLPPGLGFVVRKMMAKRVEDRYQSAAEVAEALTAVFSDVPTAVPVADTTAPMAIPLGPPNTVPGDEKTVALRTTTLWRRKPLWPLLGVGAGGVGLLGLLLVVGLVFLLLPTKKPPATSDPPRKREPWEVELDGLSQRVGKADQNQESLFEDVVKFERKYYTEPNASLESAKLLRTLPSPLDNLQYDTIPEEERCFWPPSNKQLVAVVGSQRFRSWAPLRDMVWDEDSSAPITFCEAGIFYWDKNGRLLKNEPGAVFAAAISESKPTILATQGANGNIQLWKRGDKGFKEWDKTGELWNPRGGIALTRDGKLLAAGLGGGVALWDLTGTTLKPVEKTGLVTEKPVEKIVFSSDGQWLAVSQQDGPLKVWEYRAGAWKVALEMPKSLGDSRAGAFQLLGAAASASVPTIKELADLRVGAFHPNGNLFVACSQANGPLYRWDLKQQPPTLLPPVSRQSAAGVCTGLAFTKDGNTLAVAGTFNWVSAIEWWSGLGEGEKPRRTGSARSTSYIGDKTALAFSTDGNTLALTFPGRTIVNSNLVGVGMWERERTEWKERPSPGLQTPVYGVAFSPDCQTLALVGNGGGNRYLWRVADKPSDLTGLNCLEGNFTNVFRGLLVSPSQHLVFYGHGLFWTEWTSANLKRVGSSTHVQNMRDVALARNAPLIATIQTDGPSWLALFDLTKPTEAPTFLPRRDEFGSLSCVALSPNGKTMVSGCSDGPMRFWQQQADKSWKDHIAIQQQPLNRLLFHPDGKYLIGGCRDGLIRIWSMEKEPLAEQSRLNEHHGEVTQLVLSPDATTLASADSKNRLIVWDWETRKRLLSFEFPCAVTSLAFAPDSRHLAVGLANSATYILRVQPTPK